MDYYIKVLSGSPNISFLEMICKEFDTRNYGKSIKIIIKVCIIFLIQLSNFLQLKIINFGTVLKISIEKNQDVALFIIEV